MEQKWKAMKAGEIIQQLHGNANFDGDVINIDKRFPI